MFYRTRTPTAALPSPTSPTIPHSAVPGLSRPKRNVRATGCSTDRSVVPQRVTSGKYISVWFNFSKTPYPWSVGLVVTLVSRLFTLYLPFLLTKGAGLDLMHQVLACIFFDATVRIVCIGRFALHRSGGSPCSSLPSDNATTVSNRMPPPVVWRVQPQQGVNSIADEY